jgi:hypothetical protein
MNLRLSSFFISFASNFGASTSSGFLRIESFPVGWNCLVGVTSLGAGLRALLLGEEGSATLLGEFPAR